MKAALSCLVKSPSGEPIWWQGLIFVDFFCFDEKKTKKVCSVMFYIYIDVIILYIDSLLKHWHLYFFSHNGDTGLTQSYQCVIINITYVHCDERKTKESCEKLYECVIKMTINIATINNCSHLLQKYNTYVHISTNVQIEQIMGLAV